MHTSENSSTGQLTIEPRNDTVRSMPESAPGWPVCVSDQITPITKYGTSAMMAVPIHSAIVISKAKNFRRVASTGPMLMIIPLWAGVSVNPNRGVLICGVQGVDDRHPGGQH